MALPTRIGGGIRPVSARRRTCRWLQLSSLARSLIVSSDRRAPEVSPLITSPSRGAKWPVSCGDRIQLVADLSNRGIIEAANPGRPGTWLDMRPGAEDVLYAMNGNSQQHCDVPDGREVRRRGDHGRTPEEPCSLCSAPCTAFYKAEMIGQSAFMAGIHRHDPPTRVIAINRAITCAGSRDRHPR